VLKNKYLEKMMYKRRNQTYWLSCAAIAI